jgi:tRNA A-37 threonylcarbamoyl transferase component Bud32
LQSYISSKRKTLLDANHLGSFETLWRYQSEWFEAPNDDRNGWSGVNRLSLSSPDGESLGVFLKRQQNYVRRTFLHPFTGESTFTCEFRTMRFLLKRGVPVPKPVFFDEKPSVNGLQAILMTEELVGYRPLDVVIEELFNRPDAKLRAKRVLIASVAKAVHKLHYARIQHRALYPKHLFVNIENPENPDVVIIDLEKARIKLMPLMRTLQDVSTLNRRLSDLSRTHRLYFFKHYCGVDKLGPWTKLVCRLLLWRSHKADRHSPAPAPELL